MNWAAMHEYTFLGADLREWAIALAAALTTYLVLTMGLRFVLKRLSALAASSTNKVDDAVVTILSSSNKFLFFLMSLLVGLGLLDLKEPWHSRVSQLWFIALVLQFGIWGGKAITLVVNRYVRKHAAANSAHASAAVTLMSWGMRTFLWTAVALSILSNLGVNITAFVASMGVGGIAVALAVQSLLGDLFASLSIAIDKPFEVGDFIVVDSVAGTIEYVGLKSTRIRSLGGEQIVMSNTDLLKQTISNYKRLQERRVVYTFKLTYDTTPEQAEQVPQIVKRVIESSKKLQFDRAHLLSLGDSALEYEVVFIVQDPDYNLYMDERQSLNLQLMREFAKIGVRFALPTQTVHVASVPKAAADALNASKREAVPTSPPSSVSSPLLRTAR